MSDYISRADAIEAVCRTRCGDKAKGCPAHSCLVIEEFDALPSADAVSRDVYDKRTQADEKIIDSYRQEFQKTLIEALFNDITESPNDVIESQNDVIEVNGFKSVGQAWNTSQERREE